MSAPAFFDDVVAPPGWKLGFDEQTGAAYFWHVTGTVVYASVDYEDDGVVSVEVLDAEGSAVSSVDHEFPVDGRTAEAYMAIVGPALAEAVATEVR